MIILILGNDAFPHHLHKIMLLHIISRIQELLVDVMYILYNGNLCIFVKENMTKIVIRVTIMIMIQCITLL